MLRHGWRNLMEKNSMRSIYHHKRCTQSKAGQDATCLSHEESRAKIGFNTKSYGNIRTGNIVVWAHLKWSNLRVEQGEDSVHWVLKTEVPLGSTCHKVHRQQMNLCNCQVVSKRPEMTPGWNCRVIQTNRKNGQDQHSIWNALWLVAWPIKKAR